MLLRYSFKLEAEAAGVEAAVAGVLAAGARTKDIAKPGQKVLTTSEMGQKVAQAVRERSQPAEKKAAT
jgi:3-isopropylmalate dehydrogenase